jgi:hypothetical protein
VTVPCKDRNHFGRLSNEIAISNPTLDNSVRSCSFSVCVVCRYTQALRNGESMEWYQVPTLFILFELNSELEQAKGPNSYRLKSMSFASKRNVKDMLYLVIYYIAFELESIFLGLALLSMNFRNLFCFANYSGRPV